MNTVSEQAKGLDHRKGYDDDVSMIGSTFLHGTSRRIMTAGEAKAENLQHGRHVAIYLRDQFLRLI